MSYLSQLRAAKGLPSGVPAADELVCRCTYCKVCRTAAGTWPDATHTGGAAAAGVGMVGNEEPKL
jgi:hypothetical protein